MKTWARGDFNYWACLVGVNGTGKSTRARQRAAAAAAEGVRVFVHDPDGQFPGVATYKTGRAWAEAAGAAVKAKQPFPMLARFESCEADEVLRVALAASEAANFTTPSLVVYDEGSAVGGASRHRLGDEFASVLTRRRNRACGAIMVAQFPALTHYSNLTLSTEIDLFHLDDEEQLRILRRRAGVPQAVLDRLPTLGIGEFITYKRGLQPAKTATRARGSKINA